MSLRPHLSIQRAKSLLFLTTLSSLQAEPAPAVDPSEQFLRFVRMESASWRAEDKPPQSLEVWTKEKDRLREQLTTAWGAFPADPTPLKPRKLGELKRDGYRIEKIIFQTMPEVWMTSNAYVPEGKGPFPAVLCVHGHWSGAKQDPTVQSRCIGLAKLGFFVLAVDAFGAGERGVGKALGEYHGELTAATLIPTGRVLAGIQVYENTRAIDYLQSRPEVDAKRLGVTGTSGGGNQTMYIGAWDDRLSAVVPACSVGNYQSYLGVACCMCEVVPGALGFTEEGRILSLVAPRALMVISATKDSVQFSAREARKSIAAAQPVFDLYQKPRNIRHATFEEGHGYSKAMREAMYGWMTLHLKGEGDGSPLPEPAHQTENRELLRCFPGNTRPDDWITLPQFAAREGRQLLKRIADPESKAAWLKQKEAMQNSLLARPESSHGTEGDFDITVQDKPGTNERTVVLLNIGGSKVARQSELGRALTTAGYRLITLDLRATGASAIKNDRIGNALDHTSAEWSLWLGPTLLEQWITDLRRALTRVNAEKVTLVGTDACGPLVLAAAAIDERIEHVVTINALASYLSDVPYRKQRLGVMIPGILRDTGDLPHLAALIAPRPLLITGGVQGDGSALTAAQLKDAYSFTKNAYRLEGARMEVHPPQTAEETVKLINSLY